MNLPSNYITWIYFKKFWISHSCQLGENCQKSHQNGPFLTINLAHKYTNTVCSLSNGIMIKYQLTYWKLKKREQCHRVRLIITLPLLWHTRSRTHNPEISWLLCLNSIIYFQTEIYQVIQTNVRRFIFVEKGRYFRANIKCNRQ